MIEEIIMSVQQHRSAAALIKSLCANYDGGNCLLLSYWEFTPCPQVRKQSLICKYFRDAVLPADKLLHAQIMGGEGVKGCEVCGKPFRAVSNRARYCEKCTKEQRTKATRERVRKHRGTL